MNVLTSDFECTTWSKGSAFDLRNKAVCLAWKENNERAVCHFNLEYPCIDLTYRLCVFFNAKFDLHWYRRLGYALPTKVWCCQVAEFILGGQTQRYPSLENTASEYGFGHKLDVVKLEYWDKNIQTDEIPKETLAAYASQDVDLTYKIYLKQLEQFQQQPQLYKLFKLMMLDLFVLQEMEWNGLKYDEQVCLKRASNIEAQISQLQSKLASVYPGVPINFNSGDMLSAFLYGGSIVEPYKEHIGFFKTGINTGEPKYKNCERIHILPQLVKPLPRTELKKEGFYATDEATLKKLKGNKRVKEIIGYLLELSKLEKLNSTYYKGIPEINKQMHLEEGYLHGSFNQCVAATGRLSSNKPNLQNFAGDCEDIFVSRYG